MKGTINGTMKAIAVTKFGGPENLEYLEDMDVPSIKSKQVLIKVRATSVNYADIKARHGNKGKGTLPFSRA